MTKVDDFCKSMLHWCCYMNMHYGQGNSDFPLPRYDFVYGGSTDCSAMVSHCLIEAGYNVPYYCWSGSLADALLKIGWTRKSAKGTPPRGAVLLNEKDHAAMWDGSHIIEFGGDPHEGYSTVNDFYSFPWDCYMCPPAGDTSSETKSSSTAKPAEIKYRASTDPKGEKWLTTVKGFAGCAGVEGEALRWLAMDFPGWYQVKTEKHGWLPRVRKFDVKDLENGCAGDGSPILAVRCYYETQNPAKTGYYAIKYQVAELGENWLSPLVDLSSPDGDDFAGDSLPVERFRARIVRC